MKTVKGWMIGILLLLCVASFVFLYRYRVPGEEPVQDEGAVTVSEDFSHELFDQVLQKYVDSQGLVDYTGLKKNPQKLNAYVEKLAKASPENLPTGQAQLAFWINTYNALVIKGIIDNYPTKGVRDIKWLGGFFSRVDYRVAGKRYTLNDIEHGIIRKQFEDPRIHFVLVCASMGCPKLENRAFFPETLNERLEEATEAFINNPEKVRLDREDRIFYLSAIFDWYEEDFEKTHGSVIDFIMEYLPQGDADFLKREDITVEYFDYDWSLNDQAQQI